MSKVDDELERPEWTAVDEAEYIVVGEALEVIRERQGQIEAQQDEIVAEVRRYRVNAEARLGVHRPAPVVPWEWYDPQADAPSAPDDLSTLDDL